VVTATRWTRREFLGRAALGLAAAGAAPVLLGACSRVETGGGSGGQAQQGALERAKQQGYIRVGFANEAPYGYAEPDGTLTGEAPEVARAVFKAMGIDDLQGVLTEFGSLIPGLQASRFDGIAAGMFITPERCGEILFSEPDYCAKTAFLVPKGNPEGITRFEDIAANPQLTLGVLTGAVEGDYAKKLGVKDSQLKPFRDPPSGVEGLAAGRVDAISLTSISLRNLLSTHSDANLELTEPFAPVIDGEEQFGCGGYGFRKDDTALRDAFNAELAKLKESGGLLPIIEPFGFTEAELAGDETTEQLCG
jgi:polar amino acid transport system substrate-binding protein